MGRLHTCYAPVRRSSACIATPVTPRLACIRPAASVHPEPGSNSPLYKSLYPYPLLNRNELCLNTIPQGSILSLTTYSLHVIISHSQKLPATFLAINLFNERNILKRTFNYNFSRLLILFVIKVSSISINFPIYWGRKSINYFYNHQIFLKYFSIFFFLLQSP